jgi:hypothetical protein
MDFLVRKKKRKNAAGDKLLPTNIYGCMYKMCD